MTTIIKPAAGGHGIARPGFLGSQSTARECTQSLAHAAIRVNHMNDNEILRLADVERLTGLHRATVYREIERGHFPKGIALTASRSVVGWLRDDVNQWLADRLAERDRDERT